MWHRRIHTEIGTQNESKVHLVTTPLNLSVYITNRAGERIDEYSIKLKKANKGAFSDHSIGNFRFKLSILYRYPATLIEFPVGYSLLSRGTVVLAERSGVRSLQEYSIDFKDFSQLINNLETNEHIYMYTSSTSGFLTLNTFEVNDLKVQTVFNHVTGKGHFWVQDTGFFSFTLTNDNRLQETSSSCDSVLCNQENQEFFVNWGIVPLKLIVPFLYQRDGKVLEFEDACCDDPFFIPKERVARTGSNGNARRGSSTPQGTEILAGSVQLSENEFNELEHLADELCNEASDSNTGLQREALPKSNPVTRLNSIDIVNLTSYGESRFQSFSSDESDTQLPN